MRELDAEKRAILQAAIEHLREITDGNPIICIVGFPAPGGAHIASVSNMGEAEQIEMMQMLIDGFAPIPSNTTLN